MILSICPNPSIDCTIELDSLNVGRLNRIDSKMESYSGKALNVAIGVARLSQESLATGFMFDNHKRMFEHVLDKEGVKHDFVYNQGNARTNYKIIDKRSMLTEINDRGEKVGEDKQAELVQKVATLSKDCNIAVISGSLPKGVKSDFYGKLVSAVPDGVKIIVDAEKEGTLSAIKAGKIFMVKPNLTELESFCDMTVTSKQDIVKACAKYIDLGVQNVLVSMGTDGAILTDGTNSYLCKSASVAVNSTVGAGDSMVAATCVGVSQGYDYPEILKMAVAAGTAAVTTSGTNLFYYDKYKEIYNKIFVEKIG